MSRPNPALLAGALKRLFPRASVSVITNDASAIVCAARGSRCADVFVRSPVDIRAAGGALLRQLYPHGWASA